MGGFGLDGFGRFDGPHKGFGFGWGGWDGGWNGGWWGNHRGEKKIAVITAVRAVVAKGEGIFDRDWW